MKPCTLEQLRDALEQADGIGEYEIMKTLSVHKRIDIDKLELSTMPMEYQDIINITYPADYVSSSPDDPPDEQCPALVITSTVIKFMWSGKRNATRFATHKDIEQLAARLIVKIRKKVGIEMVF